MIGIKPAIYETLTPRQRVIATIEAEAREDEDEVRRLVATCPKNTYSQNDAAYTDMMMKLAGMSVAIECDTRGHVIGALLAIIMEHDDALQVFLQNIANIRAAWHGTLAGLGIEPDIMEKAAPLQHTGMEFVIDLVPEPDAETVEKFRDDMQAYFEGSK